METSWGTLLLQQGIWMAIPVFTSGVGLLAFFILRIVRLLRNARLFGVPLSDRQEVGFNEPGTVVLCIEGPLFGARIAGLRFGLASLQGEAVSGRRTLMHATSSGFTTARKEMWLFHVPRSGHYVLSVAGIHPGNDPRCQIVFMRPHLAHVFLLVFGIVAASGLAIGGIVLFGLSAASHWGGT